MYTSLMCICVLSRQQVPSYQEVVGSSDDSEEEDGEYGTMKIQQLQRTGKREGRDGEGGKGGGGEEVDVSEDEESLNRQEEFERRYNFRFEEPGGDQVSSGR